MKTIPYLNLIPQHRALRAPILKAIERVLDHGQFILGDEVHQFEKKLATYCGCRFAVGVGNGTDALEMAMTVAGIGPGDEVITAPNSFLASASSIVAVGAKPVFVDICSDLNINPNLIEAAITPKTRAIMPVHLTGKPAQMIPIQEIANRRGLCVIEDAAQAIGTHYHGRMVGNLGDMGCFSLHPLKTLNACGDGGAITTNDSDLYSKLTQLRNIGLKNRDESDVWGRNSRLDSLQAAILKVKLDYLDEWTSARRKNAAFYTEHLHNVVGVPMESACERAAYHTFVIQADYRTALQQYLGNNGIETKIHYPIPIHMQVTAAHLGYKRGDFPVTERAADRILSLPVHEGLDEESLAYVVQTILTFYSQGAYHNG